MKLMIELDENDRGTPIELANAIIRHCMSRADSIQTEESIIYAHTNLAEIAEHIRVYLRHNKPVGNIGGRCGEE